MKHLNDGELESKLKTLAAQERGVLAEFLAFLLEVDRRKLYLRRARSSLYSYLTEDLAYAPACAQRRIDAARLAAEIPDVLSLVKTGDLCLTQIGALQRGIRFRERQQTVSLQAKKDALARVKAAPAKLADQVVAKFFEMPVVRRSRAQAQADESVRLSVTIPAEEWKLLERCRDLLAHKNPDGQWPKVLAELCEFYLKNKDPQRRSAASAEEVKKNRRPDGAVPPKIRRFVMQRDRVCQYRDPKNGTVCGSRYQLEVDHIRMRCHGGTNDPANLRLLCRQHNQLAARDALGPTRGGPFGKRSPEADPYP